MAKRKKPKYPRAERYIKGGYTRHSIYTKAKWRWVEPFDVMATIDPDYADRFESRRE